MFDKSLITTKNNLLALSAGVDSSALFFILKDMNIDFDIAIVDYNLREQSKDEVQYAKDLAKKYNKKIYLKSYDIDSFSEKKARDFRYDFFDDIIKQNNYEALITAHQLNDKLEWFLMQLTKGAGVVELIGLEKLSYRKDYKVYKPLLDLSKDDLLEYLENNKIKYFIDQSNKDNKYKRNYFRNEFSDKLISQYKDGIVNSFSYINEDIKSLNQIKYEFSVQKLKYILFNSDDINLILRYVDKFMKKNGIMLSNVTRKKIMNEKSLVISHKFSVNIVNNSLYIAPYIKSNMDKKFKELCRINKIPKNIRSYLSTLDQKEIIYFFNKLENCRV